MEMVIGTTNFTMDMRSVWRENDGKDELKHTFGIDALIMEANQ